jgi:hypothetical protein
MLWSSSKSHQQQGVAAAYARSEVGFAEMTPRIACWVGHDRHGETQGLRESMLSRVVFQCGASHPG